MVPRVLPRSARLRTATRRMLVSFAAIAVAYTLIVASALAAQAEWQLAELRAAEGAKTGLSASTLDIRIDSAGSDALVAASSRAVKTLASDRSESALASAASVFTSFVANKRNITQLRFVDAAGTELLSVRRAGQAAERVAAGLADWSDHDVVEGGSALGAGEVYVSRFEGATGDGGTRPVVRLAAAVTDEAGVAGGLVIVDVDGDLLIDRFREIMGSGANAILLDDAGDWLASPATGGEADDAVSFAQRYPDAWAAIAAADSGSQPTAAGLFTFSTAYPEHVTARLAGDEEHDARGHEHPGLWKTVSFVPSSQVPNPSIIRDPGTVVAFLAGLLLLGALTAYATRVRLSQLRLRRSVTETATRLEAVRDTLGEGLIINDSAGLITEVNREAVRLLGWSAEEMVGSNGHALLHTHPDIGVSAEDCRVRAVAATGESFRSDDEVFIRKTGEPLRVGVSATALHVDGELAGSVLVFRDMGEILRYQQEIRDLADRDALTGLPNRRVFSDRLEQALAAADRRSTPVAVLFIDLDNFKCVNDEYGHDVGDQFLRQVATRLREALRASDTLARHGGDEFVALLPEIGDGDRVDTVAGRILAGLEQPFLVDGFLLRAGASIGIALRLDGETADQLMAKADAAMYAAKESGRNRFHVSGAPEPGLPRG